MHTGSHKPVHGHVPCSVYLTTRPGGRIFIKTAVSTVLQEGCTALHVACSCRCIDVALCLLNAQAALDLLDNVISTLTNFTYYLHVIFA